MRRTPRPVRPCGPCYERDRPELKDEPWTPVTQPRLEGGADIFRVVSNGDLLVHHPYDSFETSVEAFIEQAARDPAVLAIKLALYRTSEDSPIVQALVARRRGGQAGGRARRAAGPLRRTREHHPGAHAGAGGRARRLRDRGTEDPREGLPGRSAGGKRDPSLHPRRDRELQPEHRTPLRGPRVALRGSRCSGPT